MLHKILEGTHTRIRKTREFFNVKPEVALDAFYGIAELLPDAEVYLRGEEPLENKVMSLKDVTTVSPRRKMSTDKASIIKVHSSDSLPKGARFSLDKYEFVSMSKFGFLFIHQFILDNPSLTFPQLTEVFPKSMLSSFQYCGVVAKKEEVDCATYPLASKMKAYHCGESKYLLRTSDGIDFYTTTQWTRDSFKKLLSIAEAHGYQVYSIKR